MIALLKHHPLTVAGELARSIRQILNWHDLRIVLEQVQRSYRAGQIDHEQVEILRAMAAQEGNCLPEESGELRLSELSKRGSVHMEDLSVVTSKEPGHGTTH
ncbi:MAG: hypothetical protein HY694_12635 [Deltaproteobacteria bacterium]|nr:hypothetical protein [Deltaproteobacteria bacterium]